MANNKISEHFSLTEVTRSEKAAELYIDNTGLDTTTLNSVVHTADCMELVRSLLGDSAIHINSWYRCPELNAAVGSKPTSKHILGEAVDFIAPDYGDPLAVATRLLSYVSRLDYDQLILEHTWVHISFCPPARKARNQVLSLLKSGGYATGLTNSDGVPYA